MISGGANRFIDNHADSNGGAIWASKGLTLAASDGDLIFRGNTQGTGGGIVPNAVYINTPYFNCNLAIAAAAGRRVQFYDPVEIDYFITNFSIDINNPGTAGIAAPTGTVLFDGAQAGGAHSRMYGATTVYGGILQLANGAIYGAGSSSSFTLNAGATLAVDAGRNNEPTPSGNEIRANAITLKTGSIIEADLAGAVAQGNVGATTNLTLTGPLAITSSFTVNAVGPLKNGTYTLVKDGITDFTGRFTGLIDNRLATGYSNLNSRYGTVNYLTSTPGAIELDVAGAATWTGDAGDVWSETAENWSLDGGSTEKVFKSYDSVIFNDTGITGTVRIEPANASADMTIGDMTVGTNLHYSFTGASIVAKAVTETGATGKITKQGTGVLYLFNAGNAFTGGVEIKQGELVLGNTEALSRTLNSTFVLDSGASLSLHGDITSSRIGFLKSTLSGDVYLHEGQSLQFSGDVELNGAALHVTSATAAGVGAMTVDGTLTVTGASTIHLGSNGSHYQGKTILTAASLSEANFGLMNSNFYTLERYERNGLVGVRISGRLSLMETMEGLFTPAGMSENIYRGGIFTETRLADMPASLQMAITDYVALLDDASVSRETALAAFRQLFGEHGTYALEAKRHSWRRLSRQFGDRLDMWRFEQRLPTSPSMSGSGFAADRALASPAECGLGGGRIWGGVFGSWADQDARDRVVGYEHRSGGGALGYERALGREALFGFAAAYTRARTNVDSLRTRYDADVVDVAAYGAYHHQSGLYAKGWLGFGYAWNDYDQNAVTGGTKRGDFDSQSYTAGLELGYEWELPCGIGVVPSAGVEYTHYRNQGWDEAAAGSTVANRFKSGHANVVDIPVGVRLNRVWDLGCGRFVAPEVRVAWVYAAGDHRPTVQSGYSGYAGTFRQDGANPGRDRWQFGGGLRARLTDRIDARVDYNFETSSGYKGHNLSASVGLSF